MSDQSDVRAALQKWAAELEVERRLDRVIADMRKEPLGYWGDDPGYWGNDVHNNFLRAKAMAEKSKEPPCK